MSHLIDLIPGCGILADQAVSLIGIPHFFIFTINSDRGVVAGIFLRAFAIVDRRIERIREGGLGREVSPLVRLIEGPGTFVSS